jgi:hypothetical protein
VFALCAGRWSPEGRRKNMTGTCNFFLLAGDEIHHVHG